MVSWDVQGRQEMDGELGRRLGELEAQEGRPLARRGGRGADRVKERQGGTFRFAGTLLRMFKR